VLTDKEEEEKNEIFDLIDKLTQEYDGENDEYNTSKIFYFVTMQENDIESETEKFPDEKSAKSFIVSKLKSIKNNMTLPEVGVYKA
jgi:hypothetical protein